MIIRQRAWNDWRELYQPTKAAFFVMRLKFGMDKKEDEWLLELVETTAASAVGWKPSVHYLASKTG